jgi:formylglycine-generating enzyme required for sulfatase activity
MPNREKTVFISYRRVDTSGYAGRLYDRLSERFGEDNIFMDVERLDPGVNFVDAIQDAVRSCDVLVALIGPRWLTVQDRGGGRRLDNPEDFVRLEIATALEHGVYVIPILVENAEMPRSDQLPGALQGLTHRNALRIRHERFNADAYKLVSCIEKHFRKEKQRKRKERISRRKFTDWFKRIPDWGKIVGGLAGLAVVGIALSSLIAPNPTPLAEENAMDGTLAHATETRATELTLTSAYAATQTFLAPTKTPEPTETHTPTVEPTNTTTQSPTLTPTWPPDVPPTDATLGDTWTRPADGAEMVYVPAGEFEMGSSEEQFQEVVDQCVDDGNDREDCEGWYADEKPQHNVSLDAFWIDKYEVTNAQYAAFLNEQGNQEEGGATWLDLKSGYCLIEEVGGQFQPKEGYADHPVVEVSWYGAKAYAAWASGRLPTEAEWEYAARGPDGNKYPWGDWEPTCQLAQFNRCVGRTNSIGSLPDGASWVGALDMAGNVWEWVSTLYEAYPYDAADGRENLDVDGLRVVRGGAFSGNARDVRCAFRSRIYPGARHANYGFRLVVHSPNEHSE